MFDSNIIEKLADGALITAQVTFFAALLGTGMSVLSGLGSLSGWRVIRWISRGYVEFFRGTSAIVQMFWIFFALPLIGPAAPDFIPDRVFSLSAMEAGVAALGLNMGSYGSEVVRGAINAVGRGQREASVALSLNQFQRMRYVVFPQAVLTMLPPYANLLIELLKGTALVSLITLSDLTFEAQKLRTNRAADSLELFTAILIIYFIMALVIAGFVRALERYFSRGLDIGRGA